MKLKALARIFLPFASCPFLPIPLLPFPFLSLPHPPQPFSSLLFPISFPPQIQLGGLGKQGRRLCVFKVFIEYPLNLGSCCISMFSLNLTFNKILIKQFCYFFCQNRHFFGYKCVSIQKWTWILSRWSVNTKLIISIDLRYHSCMLQRLE